jgi:hypothetical protein
MSSVESVHLREEKKWLDFRGRCGQGSTPISALRSGKQPSVPDLIAIRTRFERGNKPPKIPQALVKIRKPFATSQSI